MTEGDRDELGAHVSSAGGVENAPERAGEIEAGSLQLFTKQPSRWAERVIDVATATAFRDELGVHGVHTAGAHDSYLINLASPDPELHEKSYRSFAAELERCRAMELDFLVTHPGNATDGDHPSGLDRNADAVARALEEVPGPTRVLLEITAGAGNALGSTFEELAGMIEAIPSPQRARVGVCLDTCHAYAAGYDLVDDFDGVMARFEDVIGLERLGLFHLNDSKTPFGSHRDRHEHIGEGSLGDAPFRRIMTESRLAAIPKVMETPKGDAPAENDRRNLARLRAFRDG